MISALCYVVLYYNIDKLLQTVYIPYVIPNNNSEFIYTHKELYFLLKTTSYFMLVLYLYTLFYRLFILKISDKSSLLLSFVYTKHLRDILLSTNYTLVEYELNRGVMWAFTTPLMLKMYCDANEVSIWDINIHYHLISIIPHIFVIPFKGQPVYVFTTCIFSIPALFFLKSLNKYKSLPFTQLYILTWSIFIFINALDIANILRPELVHALYNLADTLCKFICNVVITSYNEQEIEVRENMDLQSVKFVSRMIESIDEFDKSNNKITPICKDLIKYCKYKFVNKIPKTNDKLKLELLRTILPFNLDVEYLSIQSLSSVGLGKNKEFNFTCVMFMDIVNYTELANRYKNGDTIFKLLNDVYFHFDNIIKKYIYLQKIETIGDAYMVVGDIYRTELNYKIVIKEIILLGLEFIKEIKNIETPDNIPLCIRIGINIGSVNVGILGNEIPRLCVVGNTVNIASRLQSTAEVDSIQISRHIYEYLEEIDFEMNMVITKKENIFLKNIGTVDTYNIIPNY